MVGLVRADKKDMGPQISTLYYYGEQESISEASDAVDGLRQ